MNKSNYDNFDNYQGGESIFTKLQQVFKKPLFATLAILVVCLVFAGLILASYPSGDNPENIPVIQAEATPFKADPEVAGGMDVPFQDSTLYASLRDEQPEEVTRIENLLAEEEEVDRLEAFAAEAERIIQEAEERRNSLSADTDSLIEEATGVASIPEASGGDTLDAVIARAEARRDAERAAEARIKRDMDVAPSSSLNDALQDPYNPAAADSKRDMLYKPGSSPETIEFVREVLKNKDIQPSEDDALAAEVASIKPEVAPSAESSAVDEELAKIVVPTKPAIRERVTQKAEEVASVQPAAGGVDIRPGEHYIQLLSIKNASLAGAEWSRLTKRYPDQLTSAKYRVQRADLGERGIYYRIQAGPMSKDSANEICGAIKNQKSGSCLVTQ